MHESTETPLALLSNALEILVLKQAVVLSRRRSNVRCYQDSNDESIYCNDTRHDDGDE
jgi:hypothetical protein